MHLIEQQHPLAPPPLPPTALARTFEILPVQAANDIDPQLIERLGWGNNVTQPGCPYSRGNEHCGTSYPNCQSRAMTFGADSLAACTCRVSEG